ncbi:MAG: DUF721 domain-containing protein [Candidatus Neomarinimicrobiota bacterium]
MTSLGEAITGMLKEYGLSEAVQLHSIILLWDDVVGAAIASHSKAVGVKGNTLYVSTSSATWRNEIAFQKDEILKALNDKSGSNLVKDIRIC